MKGTCAGVAVVLWLAMLPGLARPEVPLGDAFQVNTYTPGLQTRPVAVVSADGSFVVVWESSGQDGEYFGIFAQRYASNGTTAGGEFQVNTYTTGQQVAPAVDAADDGGFVTVWEGYGLGSFYGDIFGQRFDSGGAAVGTEFQINLPALGYQAAPDVAVAADGQFVVVWHDYYEVFGRRYSSSGAPEGTQFQVNTFTDGYQLEPAVAGGANGDFVVVWTDGSFAFDGRDGYGYGVFGQRYSSSGTPEGTQFQVNTLTAGDQYGPSVAAAPNGDFVVVWLNYDGYHVGVSGQRFTSTGLRAGTEFLVSAGTDDSTDSPVVATDADGKFVVAWTGSLGQYGYRRTVFGRRYDSMGTALGPPFEVNTDAAFEQLEPAVGAAPDGDFIVTWRSNGRDGSEAGIFGRRFDGALPTPTLTPTLTAAATPINTPTFTRIGSSTATSTPTAAPCVGDCNGDDQVTVSELVTAVNIALGNLPWERCPAADGNGDGAVAVNELIAAVNRALAGCTG